MIKTGSMTNPKCQECSKKGTCKNKTLCAYLYEDNIEPIGIQATNEILQPILLTPEMITKEKIEEQIKINMGIDNASLMGLRGGKNG
jgi:hypothetical protein